MKNENGRQTMFIIPLRYSSTARDGRASTPLSHQRKGEKKDSSPCAITQRLVWARVCVCVCAHLSACVYELFVSPPQALGCWVCSLKRLCFCCHLSPCLSLCVSHFHSDSVYLCFVCVSVSLPISALSVCIPLSMLYHNCFQKTRRNAGAVSHSFTASHIQRGEWPYAIWEGSWLALVVLRT